MSRVHAFIPSKNRSDIITSHTLKHFPDASVLVAAPGGDMTDVDRYRRALSMGTRLYDVRKDAPPYCGKSVLCNYALEHLVPDGDWAMFMDDDLLKIEVVVEPAYSTQTRLDETGKELDAMFQPIFDLARDKVMSDFFQKAAEKGVNLCGGGFFPNPFFRRNKWGHWAYACGGLTLVRKTEIRFPICHLDDAEFTISHLLRDGAVCINRWVHTKNMEWAPGGFGNDKERLEVYRRETEDLVRRHPEVIFAKQVRWDGYWAPKLRRIGRDKIRKWRQRHGFAFDSPLNTS